MKKFDKINIKQKLVDTEGWIKVHHYSGRMGANSGTYTKKIHYYRKGKLTSVCGCITLEPYSKDVFFLIEDGEMKRRECNKCNAKRLVKHLEETDIVAEKKKRLVGVPKLPEFLRQKTPQSVVFPFIWVKAKCSQPGCDFEGVYPTIDINQSALRKHFCIEHNTKIQQCIQNS